MNEADIQKTRRNLSLPWQKAIPLLLLIVALVYPFVFTQSFARRLMILVFLYAMLGQAWNILGGYAGQVSLGHAAFFGVGAYTSFLLLRETGITPWVGMLIGGLAAVALSQLIGWPSFRLSGHYFVIATIVLAEIVKIVFINWDWANGARGITQQLLPESLLNFQFHSRERHVPYYFIILGLLILIMLTTYLLEHSKAGYYFRAIKEDPDAARSLGINITHYKMLAMGISAFFTGAGGVFFGQFVLYIDPESVLPFSISVLVMLIPVLGGVGTLWGPIIGALILLPMSEFTRIYLSEVGQAIDLLAYGLLIMLVAVFEPRGLWALIERFSPGGQKS